MLFAGTICRWRALKPIHGFSPVSLRLDFDSFQRAAVFRDLTPKRLRD